MKFDQVVIGASGVTRVSATNFYCSVLVFQNNSAHTCRVGDSTASTTVPAGVAGGAAGKGIQLFSTGSDTWAVPIERGTVLSEWYVAGTVGDVIDYGYELT